VGSTVDYWSFAITGGSVSVGTNKIITFPAGSIVLRTIDTGSFNNMHSTAYTDNQILAAILRNTSAPVFLGTYLGFQVALFQPLPTYAGSYGEIWDSVNGSGYVRRQFLPESFGFGIRWTFPKAGQWENLNFIQWPVPIVGWGAPKAILILDSLGTPPVAPAPAGSGGGNLLWWTERANGLIMASGDDVRIRAGDCAGSIN
jgi:hypothetical protein